MNNNTNDKNENVGLNDSKINPNYISIIKLIEADEPILVDIGNGLTKDYSIN